MASKDQPKSKLLNLVENLSLQDRRDIKHFMQMPSLRLTNPDKSVLLQLIDKDSTKLLKEGDVFLDSLFKSVTNKTKVRSRILKAIEKYITYKKANANDEVKNLLLAKYYHENQKEKNLNFILNAGIKKLSKENELDGEIFKYWMYKIKIGLEKDLRQEDSKMEVMAKSLDAFYTLNRINVICEEASRSKILNQEIDIKAYISEIENLTRRNDSILFNMYRTLFYLIVFGEARYFHELDSLLSDNKARISTEQLKDFYTYLMNFCIRQINNGDLSYAKKYYDYIKTLKDKNILLVDGSIGIGRLKNVILSSIIVKEIDWALSFLDEYAKYLPASADINRTDFLLLNKAILLLYRDEPDQCAIYIHEFQKTTVFYKDFYYKITCDKLQLKVYYELGQDEALLSASDKVKKYIMTQKKLSKIRRERHANFIDTIVSMVKKNNKEILKEKKDFLILDYLWFQKIVERNDSKSHS